MDFRFAVCDDAPEAARFAAALCRQWAGSRGFTVLVDVFQSAQALLFEDAACLDYDVLILDIQMDGQSGLDLARQVRLVNRRVQIVFVTGYLAYVEQGYDVEALHYLIKPVCAEKLFSVLDRAVEKLQKSQAALYLKLKDGAARVPLAQIRFLEVRQNYVTVHAEGDYTIKKTLGELEKQLDDGFFRIGRSFIVNLRFVRKISRSQVLLHDGTALPLPRGMYEPINRAMIRFF